MSLQSVFSFMWFIIVVALVILLVLIVIDKIAGYFYVWDYADVMFAKPYRSFKVKRYCEIHDMLLKHPEKSICIAGGKFSHGGHTFLDDCLYLDMVDLNQIISFDAVEKILVVQSGATWKQILEFLDPYDLSVKAMQSYANFTVGGTISVNAHGRGIEYSTIGSTLNGLKVMLTNGTILDTYPGEELFQAVLGGYGGVAIILEATLSLTDNYLLQKEVCPTEATTDVIYDTLCEFSRGSDASDIILYNGLIYPERRDKLFNIVYKKIPKCVTNSITADKERLQPEQPMYLGHLLLEQLLRRSTIFKYCRAYFEPVLLDRVSNDNEVVWRNWELSYDTNKLGALVRFPTTTALQEYFVPIQKSTINYFFEAFNRITKEHKVNLLNISLRYVRAADVKHRPVLDYAPDDRLAVVIYYNLGNNPYSLQHAAEWTQKVLDAVVKIGGAYYLPYLPLATVEQFRAVYPGYKRYIDIKKKYDPQCRLTSNFLLKYLL